MEETKEDRPPELKPGDDCPMPGCDGKLAVYATKLVSDLRLRRFCCPVCRDPNTYGKIYIPEEYAPRRRRKQIKPRDL